MPTKEFIFFDVDEKNNIHEKKVVLPSKEQNQDQEKENKTSFFKKVCNFLGLNDEDSVFFEKIIIAFGSSVITMILIRVLLFVMGVM